MTGATRDAREPIAKAQASWAMPLVSIWLMTLVTFSVPGREGPSSAASLDVIALAKIVTRLLVLALLGAVILAQWNQPRWEGVCRLLLPFGLFLAWAFASAVWSPLKAISLGQALSLLVLVSLAAVIAALWDGPEDLSRLLFHLSGALLAVAAVLLLAYVIAPESSGLVRGLEIEGSLGIMHPTSAGSTGSIGVMILVMSRLLTSWRWARNLLIPGLACHGTLLLLATSRAALFLTAVIGLLALIAYLPRALLASAILAAALIGAVYMAVDPELVFATSTLNRVEDYWRRGESEAQMRSFNGRTELWEAIWQSVKQSPWIGHGYFVSSNTGMVDVWSGPSLRTAHNTVLQILVSTGLIGLALFLWAMYRPLAAGCRCLFNLSPSARWPGLFLLLGIWFLGWGQLCESFMGPLQPESVVFFTMFGALIGNAVPEGHQDLEDIVSGNTNSLPARCLSGPHQCGGGWA